MIPIISRQLNSIANCSAKRWILVLIICGMTFIIIFLLTLALGAEKRVKSLKSVRSALCVSKTCVNSASDILNSLDRSIDPCDDFYRFTCGGFRRSTILPNNVRTIDSFTKIDTIIRQQMKHTLEEPDHEDDPKFVKLGKKFYRSCINTSTLKPMKTKPLLDIVNKLGGWPVREGSKWNESQFNWQECDHAIRKIGFRPQFLMHFYTRVDSDDPRRFILHLQDPVLRIRPQNLEDRLGPGVNTPYFMHMKNVAVDLGATRTDAEVELSNSFKFEMELSRLSMETSDESHPRMSIKNLTTLCSSIRWLDYVNGLLPQDITVDESEIIIVHIGYIKKFEELMSKTPKRTQANYLLWRAVNSAADHLSPVIRRDYVYTKRSQYCHSQVQTLMPVSTSSMYVRRYSSPFTKEYVGQMAENIKNQFVKSLDTANWLDEESKQNALKKLRDMQIMIAAPDTITDINAVDNYHDSLELDGDNYLLNYLNVSRFDIDRTFKQLREDVRDVMLSERFNDVVTANAMYYVPGNSVIVSAALIQSVFFNLARPRYMNYGSIGSVIGHEMNHAYHGVGNEDNLFKSRSRSDWWTPLVRNKLKDKMNCLIKQYDNYTIKEIGVNVNGSLTIKENIADNGGFKIAYLAYAQWISEHGPEPLLPGLPYTNKQMFWISAALPLCSKDNLEYLKRLIKFDTHAVKEFRVVGTFSNIPEFSQDFRCPVGSYMNPKDKCVLW